jgi:phage tail protein X
MPRQYLSREGDTLDFVAFLEYGQDVGIVEQVLAVNPHLAEYGARLPYGVAIALPDVGMVHPRTAQAVTLW